MIPVAANEEFIHVDIHDSVEYSLPQSTQSHVDINLTHLTITHRSYTLSSLSDTTSVTLQNFVIMDYVKESKWRTFLGGTRHKNGYPRESDSLFLKIQIDRVDVAIESDLIVEVDITPLRLYVDQDTLNFISLFNIGKLGQSSKPKLTPFIRTVGLVLT